MKYLTKIQAVELIGEQYNDFISDDALYEVKRVKARSLLTPKRLDILIKILCLEKLLSDFSDDHIYREHIKIMTAGSFKESGSDDKFNFDCFKNVFVDLYNDIKINGFDDKCSLIPVSSDFTPINGAHRVAVCAFLDIDIDICVLTDYEQNYNVDFFKMRGTSDLVTEQALIKLMLLNEKYICGIVWPSAEMNERELSHNINTIEYSKSIATTLKGVNNVVLEAYRGEEWLGSHHNGYVGSLGKAVPCFGKHDSATEKQMIFFIMNSHKCEIFSLKESFREQLGLGKHSIHICDNNAHSLPLSRYMLNPHAELIINNSTPFKYKKFISDLEELRQSIPTENILILDGSSTLGILGLRAPNDIDYISRENLHSSLAEYHDIDSSGFHASSKNEILNDSSKSIYIYGFNFLSIDELLYMKKNRNVSNDHNDCILLKSFIENRKEPKFSDKLNFYLFNIKSKIKSYIYIILMKLGVFHHLRNMKTKYKNS